MSQKFKSQIDAEEGIKLDKQLYDSSNSAGTSGQILSSTGTATDWINQGDVVAGEADKALSLTLRVKNTESVALTKGQVVCAAPTATPPSGNVIEVKLADNNGTDSMPAIGILNEGLDAAGGANDEGEAIMFGRISGIDTSAFSVGDEVFVSDTAGALTVTKPTGVKYIQKVGVVMRDDATNGTIEVFGAGRTNDVPTPLYVDHANQRVGIGETSPDAKLDVAGRAIIGTGNTIGTVDASIIGSNNNATTDTIIDSNTSAVIGDANSGRYGNTVISDRTLRIGRADNIGGTASNTTGILNFNDFILANTAYSNEGGFMGYFPPPTSSNDYYFFSAHDSNVLDSVFSPGSAPEAARATMSFSPNFGTNSAGNDSNAFFFKTDSNNSSGAGLYFNVSQNNSSASSRGIVTLDCRHQNQNYEAPDGHSLFEITSGYGRTKFLIKQTSGQSRVGINTTSPAGMLHVESPANASQYTILGKTVGINNWSGLYHHSSDNRYSLDLRDGSATQTVTINSNGDSYLNGGNVGIGVNPPTQKLDVNGNIKMTETAATTDTDKFIVSDSGVLKYRTGSQVLSDIGAAASSSLNNYLPLSGGTMTGSVAFSNYNITGVNQLEINDPGEGIVWKAGSSGDITLAVVDDTSDNILRLSGTNAELQVGTNRVLTTADEGSGNGLDADTLDGNHASAFLTGNQTITLSGDVSGSGTTSIAVTVNNDSHNHSRLYEKSTITYGDSYLQWTDLSGTGGAGTNGNAPGNPFNDWHHHLIMNHANGNGYYVDMAFSFHYDRVHFRRLTGGSLSSWQEFIHTGNYTSLLDARYYTESESDSRFVNVSGDTMTGDLTIGSGSADNYVRSYFNDGTYTEMRGYGLQFSRAASYIRPTADNTKALYLGSSTAQWNALSIDASTTTFNTNGSENMRITSTGNVGIGETNPDTLLHITGNEPTIKLEDNVGVDYYNPKIEFFGSLEGGTLEYISNPGFSGMRLHYRADATNQDTFLELKNGQAAFTSANITGGTNVSMTGELQVFGGDTSYFSAGNLAIGATTASERLVVSGNASITNNVYVGSGNTLKSCTYSAQYSVSIGKNNVLGGNSCGIIGIGNTIDCTAEPWSDFGGNFIAGKNNTINNQYTHANAVFGQANTLGDSATSTNNVANALIAGSEHSVFSNNSFTYGLSCFSDINASHSLTGGYDSNNFSSFGSVAIGAGATASAGNNQFAFGTGVTTPTTTTAAYGTDQFVVGKFNEYTNASSVPHRFAVGNGANDGSRDTPFCVIGGGTYTNGQVSIGDSDGYAYTSVPYSIFHVNGRATSSYSSTFTTTSDERVKKNIVDYSKGLAEIIQVQPKSYAFNGKGNTIEDVESIGVLAQEIKEVFPETVGTVNKKLNPEDEQETELYTVDISPVTYALINAVKELNAKVEALEARIQTLEGN